MTLGCGAIAGNITSDNIGPLHLINIKRIAYAVRKPEEAFQVPAAIESATIDRGTVVAAVERYLTSRGVTTTAGGGVAGVVDRFLSARKAGRETDSPPPKAQLAPPATPAPHPAIAAFVCENDVRDAVAASRKIFIGPKTIITPSARDLGDQFGILVLAQR
jgi:acetaldehyde dehydrogenase (acetylating)